MPRHCTESGSIYFHVQPDTTTLAHVAHSHSPHPTTPPSRHKISSNSGHPTSRVTSWSAETVLRFRRRAVMRSFICANELSQDFEFTNQGHPTSAVVCVTAWTLSRFRSRAVLRYISCTGELNWISFVRAQGAQRLQRCVFRQKLCQ